MNIEIEVISMLHFHFMQLLEVIYLRLNVSVEDRSCLAMI